MDERLRHTIMAEAVVTRQILADLMAHQIMQAADPIAACDDRSKFKLAAFDVNAERRADELSQLALRRMEEFWEGVRLEVEERVRFQQRRGKGR